jgi:hypothetical protein
MPFVYPEMFLCEMRFLRGRSGAGPFKGEKRPSKSIQEIHMSEKMIIPDEFQGSIKRLLNRIPSEQRDDETLQTALLVYLKLGGEKLARHYIEISKKGFPDQMVLIKKQLHDGVDEDEDSNGDNPDDAERVEEYAADFNKPDSDSEVFV